MKFVYRIITLLEIWSVIVAMPPDACTFAPTDQTSEFDEQLIFTTEEFFHFLFEFLCDSPKQDNCY